jgi:hypothetical protein
MKAKSSEREAKTSQREERLAQALRENLKRRKARDRAVASAAKAVQPETATPQPDRVARDRTPVPMSEAPRPNKALKED